MDGGGLSGGQSVSACISQSASLPRHVVSAALRHMQYFAKVDNLWGYHQLRLDKKSSRVTAIITPWGVYRFLACPFGISTAPGEYQARMAHKVLEGYYLNGAVVYIDDTVVYGKDASSFLRMLDLVLDRMVKLNVPLKP